MINEATLTAGDDDPVTDDELLYRRIPESTGWYDPRTGTVNPEAFAPHKEHDRTGLSVTRAKYRGSSYNEAMRGRSGKTYYVAVLRVGDGIVLASDGQITHGMVRSTGKKIRGLGGTCLWAAAGELALILRCAQTP